MTARILDSSNEKDAKTLSRPSRRVQDMHTPEMVILRQNMQRICNQPGVAGIAAIQLGKRWRMFALNVGKNGGPMFFYNARIVGYSEKTETKGEGCLSVIGKNGFVERSDEVNAEWEDHRHVKFSHTFTGFWARAFQHEMDHCEGILYTKYCDRLYTEEELETMFADAKKISAEEIIAAATGDMTSALDEIRKPEEAISE